MVDVDTTDIDEAGDNTDFSRDEAVKRFTELVDSIAASVVLTDPGDIESCKELTRLITDAEKAELPKNYASFHDPLRSCLVLVETVANETSEDPAGDLLALSEKVIKIQTRLHQVSRIGEEVDEHPARVIDSDDRGPSGRSDAADTFSRPEWVDKEILVEFVSTQKSGLEEIEAGILLIEKDSVEAKKMLKGPLHNMKGEAGIVGLDMLSQVYHSMEDLLDIASEPTILADRLLQAKDWILLALESLCEGRKLETSSSELLEMLQEGFVDPVSDEADQKDVKAGPVTEERDEETILLIVDFVDESLEGLSSIDELLLDMEKGLYDPEKINAVFRVFHTIKGVAGFLDFEFIQSLAHQTETMLNLVRENKLKMKAEVVDLSFESTAMMTLMMNEVQEAVKDSVSTTAPDGFHELINKLRWMAKSGPDSGISGLKDAPVKGSSPIRKEHPDDTDAKIPSQQKDNKESRRAIKIKESLRVDAERLDKLVDLVGELAIAESMVTKSREVASIKSRTLTSTISRLDKITREIQEISTSLRMVPVKGVFQKMSRLVRDLARKSGKDVVMTMSGEETELDKSVVDKIGDPLVHMIRNAVDHGIESAEEREAAGKDRRGTISLNAYHMSGSIFIEIRDDGKGLDKNAILTKALEKGIITNAAELSDKEVFDLIFKPGFSTAEKITDVSGRGVGMDVVKKNIVALRGSCEIQSELGVGTVFSIRLPLTLAMIEGLVTRVGKERFVVPSMSVISSFRPDPGSISSMHGRCEVIALKDSLLPLFRLNDYFENTDSRCDVVDSTVLIVESGEKRIGLMVDELIGKQQVVIKTLQGKLKEIVGLSGSAIMPDGKVALIIDVDGLIKSRSKRKTGENYKTALRKLKI